MEIEEAAVAVAGGKRSVVEDAAAISIIEASEGHPVPVALHRTGDWCTVFSSPGSTTTSMASGEAISLPSTRVNSPVLPAARAV